jgi:hypothetical protein
MSRRIKSVLAIAALAAFASASSVNAQAPASDTIRIGYQKSSTLTAILKTNGELEKALAPLGVRISWHEFTSGLPLLEAINTGNVDFGADVADTVPLFAQAAGAKLAYIAEEAASPSAQAILVGGSPIRTIADLKGKKVAVTKGAAVIFCCWRHSPRAVSISRIFRLPISRRRTDARPSSAAMSTHGWRGIRFSPAPSANPTRGYCPTAATDWRATSAIIFLPRHSSSGAATS